MLFCIERSFLLKHFPKHEVLLNSLTKINQAAQSGAFSDHTHYCSHCRKFRFDPLLNRTEAGAYISFSPSSLTVIDCTKQYDLQPVKLDNVVRYHLSSLNQFSDSRIRP